MNVNFNSIISRHETVDKLYISYHSCSFYPTNVPPPHLPLLLPIKTKQSFNILPRIDTNSTSQARRTPARGIGATKTGFLPAASAKHTRRDSRAAEHTATAAAIAGLIPITRAPHQEGDFATYGAVLISRRGIIVFVAFFVFVVGVWWDAHPYHPPAA